LLWGGDGNSDGISVWNNWAKFSELTGGIIGQTLSDGACFPSFRIFLLGMFLFGEKIMGHKWHFVTGLLIFLGSWASGFLLCNTFLDAESCRL
jgi:cytochrome d ubiquinol oxidase subunit I